MSARKHAEEEVSSAEETVREALAACEIPSIDYSLPIILDELARLRDRESEMLSVLRELVSLRRGEGDLADRLQREYAAWDRAVAIVEETR